MKDVIVKYIISEVINHLGSNRLKYHKDVEFELYSTFTINDEIHSFKVNYDVSVHPRTGVINELIKDSITIEMCEDDYYHVPAEIVNEVINN